MPYLDRLPQSAGYGFLIGAILLLHGATGTAHGQPGYAIPQPLDPALESQPEAERSQQDSRPASQQDAAPEQDGDSDFLSAVQGIEAAIRDFISEGDEAARQRQEDREQSDLKAQEKMARWTFGMSVAAFASVLLTAIGVLLIWWTLGHTKTAAIAAKDAVEEAKKTTLIADQTASEARRANEINREFMIAEQRAWIRIDELKVVDGFSWRNPTIGTFTVQFSVMNIGKSPAYDVSVYPLRAVNAGNHNAVRDAIEKYNGRTEPRRLGTVLLFPNETYKITKMVRVKLPECIVMWPKIVGDDLIVQEACCSFYIIGVIEYNLSLFGEQKRYTAFTYHLTKENWGGPINIAIGCDPIPADEMRLRRAGTNGMIAT